MGGAFVFALLLAGLILLIVVVFWRRGASVDRSKIGPRLALATLFLVPPRSQILLNPASPASFGEYLWYYLRYLTPLFVAIVAVIEWTVIFLGRQRQTIDAAGEHGQVKARLTPLFWSVTALILVSGGLVSWVWSGTRP
ncbi:MAG TPA: hypothetical protein VMK12_07530 [Anaeromyxobacteraceae bacterium]|nr:hypothetical protein [Anaeromyxobacteraceae bacterium]